MCLAVPGRIIAVRGAEAADSIAAVGTIDFQGSTLDVSLAFTPEAQVGDWVLVHAGFALQVLNEAEAMATWQYLEPEDVEEIRSVEPSG
ncbi:MAG: hydrogenase assembly protein HypC [Phycisphaerae bacterium]|jgi:hydrogenase expression/formation protein HypC